MRLIDGDALVYELTEMVRYSTGEYKHGICAARLVATDAPTIGGWISVEDGLPKDGQHVVVQHEVNGIYYEDVAHYFSERWWLDGMSNGVELNAIRWYLLPEPPEEVTGDDRQREDIART